MPIRKGSRRISESKQRMIDMMEWRKDKVRVAACDTRIAVCAGTAP